MIKLTILYALNESKGWYHVEDEEGNIRFHVDKKGLKEGEVIKRKL